MERTRGTKVQEKAVKEKNTAKEKKKLRPSVVLVAAAAAFMLIKGAMLQPEIIKNQDTIAELEAQKTYEQKRGEEIDNMKQNVNSDEYIEKIAREKLGMIRKDEILFIDVNGEE